MAKYYLCEEHKLAFPQWNSLTGHWKFKHIGETIPDIDDVEVDEDSIPEDFTIKETWKKMRAADKEKRQANRLSQQQTTEEDSGIDDEGLM